jgi:peptidoglycan-associated lipoprotein
VTKNSRGLILAAAATVLALGVGCGKKNVAAATPPAPAPVREQAATGSTTPPPAQPERAVTRPPSETLPQPRRTPDAATKARIDQLLARIQDAYFDYDKHALRPDAMTTLEADSKELRDIIVQYPDYKLTIEGYCDERGSAEYNLALGDARAKAAKDYLVGVGIPAPQLLAVSYGKEHPVCDEHSETCWQKNRRVHIVAMAR